MSEEKIKNNQRYVLDTSALMALAEDEAGADIVFEVLQKAKHNDVEAYVSFMTVTEACYKIQQHRDESAGYKMFNYLRHLPIKRIDVDDMLILSAASLKAVYALSMADAWILATAKNLNGYLIHKDPEFAQVKDIIQQIILPYKKGK